MGFIKSVVVTLTFEEKLMAIVLIAEFDLSCMNFGITSTEEKHFSFRHCPNIKGGPKN